MKYSRDIFYVTALILIVVAGCQTPLGRFNKQDAVVACFNFNFIGGKQDT